MNSDYLEEIGFFFFHMKVAGRDMDGIKDTCLGTC